VHTASYANGGTFFLRDRLSSPSAIFRVENSKVPDMATFQALCDWLNIPPTDLVENTVRDEVVKLTAWNLINHRKIELGDPAFSKVITLENAQTNIDRLKTLLQGSFE
jgi:hypothetical protein